MIHDSKLPLVAERSQRKRKSKKSKQQQDPLPVAREKLRDAIFALIRVRRHTIHVDTKIKRVKLLSRYDELAQAVAAHRGGSGGKWQGQLPFWVDAMMLLGEIDDAVVKMHPAPNEWPGWTAERLQVLEAKKWRPQDCDDVFKHAKELETLVALVDKLFNPQPIPLDDACPKCGVKTVYRNSDGEQVRTPALQITELGCTCGNCKANWPVDHLPLLGRLLGYKPKALIG